MSDREFEIVQFLMRNANRIFDKERIYEAVIELCKKIIKMHHHRKNERRE